MILAGVLSVLFIAVTCDAARILAYFPIPSYSHQVVYRAYTEELSRRGHEVTVIGTDLSPNPPENLTQIDVHDISYKLWREGMSFVEMREGDDDDVLRVFPVYAAAMVHIMDYQLSHPEVKKILAQKEDFFDLIVAEAIVPPFALALKNKFKAPVIGISSMTALLSCWETVGAPTHPIIYADAYRKNFIIDTTWKKLQELRTYLKTRSVLQDSISLVEEHLLEKYFGKNAKSVNEVLAEIDFLILNANPLFTGFRPVGANVLLVHGLQLKEPKILPKDLKEFADSAKEGLVYFSFGSNALSKDFSPEVQQMFKDALRKLPYKVIWKYELDEMEGKPDNVKIVKWVPQMDLLAHENVKAYIMQGGQQSIDEAIFNKVPIVGIPVLGDQNMNIQRVIRHGLGVGLHLNTLTSENLVEAVNKVIDDKSFKKNITKFSEMLQDQPEPPLERAIWWTEYVIRHKGAAHLRSPAAGISDWDYFMLDVLFLVLGLTASVIVPVALVICLLTRFIRNNGSLKKKLTVDINKSKTKLH